MLKPPSDESTARLYAWIDDHTDEMVASLQGVLRIPSLEAAAEAGAPFGAEVKRALAFTLAHAAELGFRTKDVDGFAGHAEFGEGDEMVAAVGHLDVVPEGDGWKHAPYGATIEDGYIYARGSSDDKGPTWAALYGACALLNSGLPLRRRVRVIFGCNEESGFQCVHHYWEVAREERPVFAFTPDAGFPLVYAEKGIANIVLHYASQPAECDLCVTSLSGGRRPNMVPDSADAVLAGSAEAVASAAAALDALGAEGVTSTVEHAELKVHAVGKSAHGSRPMDGVNAVIRLADALLHLALPADEKWLRFLVDASGPDGTGLGIAGSDEVAGELTSNLGIFEFTRQNGALATWNIRYPVTWSIQRVSSAAMAAGATAGWNLHQVHDQPPLYVPLDKEPVSTLLRVYREATGDEESQPRTMGGGTYARATPNAVAYGAGFPGGSDGPAHEPDERIAISTVVDAAKVFAVALYELAR
ncbi:MAG: dipeptidase PepV [Armatimonadetes bacterium]|nr:dipeptidase PepV [Armatimonadota bacterium]MDE2207063.1 dipeptidase PepV [Armatimonadota bacterium]